MAKFEGPYYTVCQDNINRICGAPHTKQKTLPITVSAPSQHTAQSAKTAKKMQSPHTKDSVRNLMKSEVEALAGFLICRGPATVSKDA